MMLNYIFQRPLYPDGIIFQTANCKIAVHAEQSPNAISRVTMINAQSILLAGLNSFIRQIVLRASSLLTQLRGSLIITQEVCS